MKKLWLLLSLFFCLPTQSKPLSDTMNIDPIFDNKVFETQNKAISHSLSIMDKMFDFPEPRQALRVGIGLMPPNFAGIYNQTTNDMVLNVTGSIEDIPNITFIHETFHYLDYVLFPIPTGKMTKNNDFYKVIKVINKSRRVKDIRIYSNLFQDDSRVRDTSSYLLDNTELCARAFAQYIMIKSNDETLKEEFNRVSPLWNNGQWTKKDFAPIYKEMDEFFKKKKWLNP